MEPYRQLELEFGKWSGVENVVACASGTASLHLAFESLQLPSEFECILCDFNMIACARSITLAGGRPVLVDCLDNLLMDPELVEKAVDYDHMEWLNKEPPNVRVILVTHIYGRYCDMEDIIDIAKKYDLYVIEDLAEAHGVKPHPLTDASCWSFYKNKIVAGEEGGAVAFRNLDAAVLASHLRSLGFTDRHDFHHIPRGHNYRMSNCHAELILQSLKRVDENMTQRRWIEEWYNHYIPRDVWRMPKRNAPWVYDLRIPGLDWCGLNRIVEELNKEGIAARHGFKTMHSQREYENCRRVGGENATRLSKEVLYLPIQPGKTTEEDVKHSFEVIKRIVG